MADDLPRANVKRIVKAKVLEMAAARFWDGRTSRDLPIHKDALIAFSESAKIFIHYLSATANDICRESKRQTLNAEDVLKAVEEIEFAELIEPLRSALEGTWQKREKLRMVPRTQILAGYRRASESKKVETKGTRKRKLEKSMKLYEDENGEVDKQENGDNQDAGSDKGEDNGRRMIKGCSVCLIEQLNSNLG